MRLVRPDGSELHQVAGPAPTRGQPSALVARRPPLGVTVFTEDAADGQRLLVDVRDGTSRCSAAGPAARVCAVSGDGAGRCCGSARAAPASSSWATCGPASTSY